MFILGGSWALLLLWPSKIDKKHLHWRHHPIHLVLCLTSILGCQGDLLDVKDLSCLMFMTSSSGPWCQEKPPDELALLCIQYYKNCLFSDKLRTSTNHDKCIKLKWRQKNTRFHLNNYHKIQEGPQKSITNHGNNTNSMHLVFFFWMNDVSKYLPS